MGVLSGAGTDRDQRLWRTGRVAELSSGMAHEVRNPLNAISIHLEVLADKLREGARGKIPEHLSSNLDAIRKQIRRLDEVIRRFADFAQGRTDHQELGALVQSTIELCAFPLRHLGMEVLVGDLPNVRLGMDGATISLALVEIVLLGIESAEVGGKLRIEGRVQEDRVLLDFIFDTSSKAPDPERLAMIGELLENQGGSLDAGARGRYARFFLPLEVQDIR